MNRIAFLAALIALFCGGCASYQLGNPAELPYRSLSVAPTKNLSTLPQIEAPLNAALRQAILQSGSLELVESSADAVVELTVIDLKRDIAAVTSTDVGRGRKFELSVELELSVRQPGKTGEAFINQRAFTVVQDIFADGDLVDAEYQATPELSRKIADRVAEILVDRW